MKYHQHIYDIVRECDTNIIHTSFARSIIISGVSGSEKIERSKPIFQFIPECAGNDNKIENY